MDKDKASCPKKDSQNEGSQSGGRLIDCGAKEEVGTEEVDSDTKGQYQGKWPNRIIALATCLLAIITFAYTLYTRDQVKLTREMFGATRDAMRLEQRPWLGYHRYEIQARKDFVASWEDRGPEEGEEFRIRLFIQNVGQTPAVNVQLMSSGPEIVEVGEIPKEPVLDLSHINDSRQVIFPDVKGLVHDLGPFILLGQEYFVLGKELFFWARLSYCDITGGGHWTQIGISYALGTDGLVIRWSRVSLDSSESNHPDCKQ